MAGTALLGRLTWQIAEVVDVVAETPSVKTIAFDVPGWPGHRAGQHVDIRLTAEDGYQAERSYSIASAPDGERLELTVERLDDGEVSPYLNGELRGGDHTRYIENMPSVCRGYCAITAVKVPVVGIRVAVQARHTNGERLSTRI